jgi:hypothetical protein
MVLGCALILFHVAPPQAVDIDSVEPGAETRKLVPVDDSRTDPALADVRRRLLHAAARKDAAALAPLVASSVTVGFELPTPRAQFLQDVARGVGDLADFWRDLRDALEVGLSKAGDGAYAPAIHLKLGDTAFDMVVTRREVKAYASPDPNSEVVATLSYDLVNAGPDDITQGHSARYDTIRIDGYEYLWRQIVTPSEKLAWIPWKYLHGPTDTHFYFQKVAGQWVLVAVGAGD